MGYVEAFRAVESTFSEAIVLSKRDQINQNGVYLFFEGSSSSNPIIDTLSFTVAVVAHSYVGENGVMGKVQELRLKALNSCFDIEFKKCRGVDFENSSLYVVAMEFSLEINIKEEYKL